MDGNTGYEQATLGGGCFWCLEPLFEEVNGVQQVVVGYAGGHVPRPSYEQVCTGRTGHAEVAQITFDPQQISYAEILEMFFASHDPTTLNRQGGDVGPQYRSIILTHDPRQQQTAEQLVRQLNADNTFGKPVVTQVEPLGEFYPAEDYHQGYFKKNPTAGYCRVVINPKVAKFRQQYRERLKNRP